MGRWGGGEVGRWGDGGMGRILVLLNQGINSSRVGILPATKDQ
ncbi:MULTISPECIES: hypothetical protein [unclassified Moorena]|nr:MULTISPECIES: hypothetical protein [unclassified Moorena]